MNNIEAAKAALREYGEAIRGDWSDIDGRSVRSNLRELEQVLDGDMTLGRFRARSGICPSGAGHWEHHCASQCAQPEDQP